MMAIYYFLSVNRAHLRTEGELIIIIIKRESCMSVCLFAFSEATRSPSIIKFWLKASFGPGWVMTKPDFWADP